MCCADMHPPPFPTTALHGLADMAAGWVARYDRELMRPPEATGAGISGASAAWRAWCFAAAGDGSTPLWRPWLMPQVQQRFVMASSADPAGPWLDALMCHLDGSQRLHAAGGRFGALALRWRVKFGDIAWWRVRRPEHPWDAGYLDDTPATRLRLDVFLPRRATLLVAVAPPPVFLARCAQTLSIRQSAFRHPVRLLVVGGLSVPVLHERRLE
jgi:hypothetical protein